jgi:hypothetical protein
MRSTLKALVDGSVAGAFDSALASLLAQLPWNEKACNATTATINIKREILCLAIVEQDTENEHKETHASI